MEPTLQGDGEPKPFTVEAGEVLLEVRTSVGRMLEACGTPVQSVQRAYRRLGIDKKLAWRLAKVLQSEDPYAAARHMPGSTAMRALFKRAEDQRVAPPVVERARRAIDGFERFVDAHAQNRRTLDLMLSAHTATSVEETDVVHRKEATTALSYTWGVLAKAQLRTYICHPSGTGRVDVASTGGFVDLQWIRPNVGWVVSHKQLLGSDSGPLSPGMGVPLDKGIERGSVPLLRDYCSAAMPPMRRVEVGNGRVLDEVIQSNVGTTTATTCILGEVNYAWMPRYREVGIETADYAVRARTPCEYFLFDLLLHRDLITDDPPKLVVFGDFDFPADDVPISDRSRHRLMAWQGIEDLGWGLTGAYTPHFSPYVEMLGDCFGRLDWDPSEYQLLRASIEYPVTPSTMAIQFVLPAAPAR